MKFSLGLEETSSALSWVFLNSELSKAPSQPPVSSRLTSNLCLTVTFCRAAAAQPTVEGYYERISVKDPNPKLIKLNFNFNSTKCE